MNFVHDVLYAVLNQSRFMSLLPMNPAFVKYQNSRTKKARIQIQSMFNACDHRCWNRIAECLKVTAIFREAHLLCSSEQIPLSCFPLVVQALKNELLVILDDEDFDTVLGDDTADDVKEMFGIRFNMDGCSTPGQKMELLDPFHIWTYLCDSFSYEWRNNFKVEGEGGVMYHATKMVEYFVPQSVEAYEVMRKDLVGEFEVNSFLPY